MKWQSRQQKQVQKLHRILRKKGPYHFDKKDRSWHVVTYKECQEVLSDTDLYSNVPVVDNRVTPDNHLLNLDPPDHTRLRKYAVQAFSPSRMAKHLPVIKEISKKYLDVLAYNGEVDFVKEYSLKIPLDIMCDIVGYTNHFYDNEKELLNKWARETFGLLEGHHNVPTEWQNLTNQYIQFYRNRGDDSRLIYQLIQPDMVKNDIISMVQLLFTAGIETTTDLINNILLTIDSMPEMKKILEDKDLIPNFVDEVLRTNASTPRLFSRWTKKNVVFNGNLVGPGTEVIVWVSSANMDESVFEDPEEFRLDRDKNQNLSFGYGIHMCVGQILAKTEAYHATENILKHNIEILDVDSSWANKKFIKTKIYD